MIVNTTGNLGFNPFCFRAYDSGGTTLTDATVVQINLATESYDYNSNFATSAYTIPVTGVYHFDGCVAVSASTTIVSGFTMIYVDAAETLRGLRGVGSASGDPGLPISGDLLLTAGQVVTLHCRQDSAGNETTSTGSNLTYFSGHLVHRLPA